MSPGRALVLLLLACLASITPLAYATPPDPTWMKGVYDAADGDEIIVALTCAAWAAEIDPLGCLAPLFMAIQFVPRGEPRHLVMAVRPAFLGRAPPLA
jgi:hypothetical protein